MCLQPEGTAVSFVRSVVNTTTNRVNCDMAAGLSIEQDHSNQVSEIFMAKIEDKFYHQTLEISNSLWTIRILDRFQREVTP